MRMTAGQSGSVTLMVLVMLLVFGLIFGATAALITRQSNQISQQSQHEQIYGVADSGVQYALWLLKPSPRGGGVTSLQMCEGSVAGATNHAIMNEAGEVLGSFTLEFSECSSDAVRVRSLGVDAQRTDVCQAIEAEFARDNSGQYQRTSWHAVPGGGC